MPSLASILKSAKPKMLLDFVVKGRPKTWSCDRCGEEHTLASRLTCKTCGIGLRTRSADGPEVYDAVVKELERRNVAMPGRKVKV